MDNRIGAYDVVRAALAMHRCTLTYIGTSGATWTCACGDDGQGVGPNVTMADGEHHQATQIVAALEHANYLGRGVTS